MVVVVSFLSKWRFGILIIALLQHKHVYHKWLFTIVTTNSHTYVPGIFTIERWSFLRFFSQWRKISSTCSLRHIFLASKVMTIHQGKMCAFIYIESQLLRVAVYCSLPKNVLIALFSAEVRQTCSKPTWNVSARTNHYVPSQPQTLNQDLLRIVFWTHLPSRYGWLTYLYPKL